MLSSRSRVFAISRQIRPLTLLGMRNSPPTTRFVGSLYSTLKETAGLNDTLISRADDEQETLPPLNTLNDTMMPDHENPTLPEKVLRPSYPSPHLNVNQVREYLHPLYSRGWGIQVIEKKGPSLSLDLQFSTFQRLCGFLPFLNEVMKKERVRNPVYRSFSLIRF